MWRLGAPGRGAAHRQGGPHLPLRSTSRAGAQGRNNLAGRRHRTAAGSSRRRLPARFGRKGVGNGLNGNPPFLKSSAVIGSAATRSAGPARTLFRAVSKIEFASTRAKAGSLRDVPQSAEGKCFAMTYDAAMEWGNRLSSDSIKVLLVEVPKSLPREAYYWPRLDGIGPVYFITMEQLETYVVRVVGVSK